MQSFGPAIVHAIPSDLDTQPPMSLEAFGQSLKSAREEKKLSLAAISDATRINTRFLESIEAGKFSILPQTYIRAFIRAYAKAVELDPDEVIRRYEAEQQQLTADAEQWVAQAKKPVALPVEPAPRTTLAFPNIKYREILLLGIMLLSILLIVYLSDKGTVPVGEETPREVPFDHVVKESEAAIAQAEPEKPAALPMTTVRQDSLELEIVTLDSVWMMITIDKTRKGEYLFPPNRRRTWVGREEFLISMGNAGNATFRLNGRELGPLGRKGAVVRDVLITESGIHRP